MRRHIRGYANRPVVFNLGYAHTRGYEDSFLMLNHWYIYLPLIFKGLGTREPNQYEPVEAVGYKEFCYVTHCRVVRRKPTDVSERNVTQRVSSASYLLHVGVLVWLIYSTLMMEATYSTETSADFQRTTCCCIPEDRTLHIKILPFQWVSISVPVPPI
jgi:hypothetical protein